MTSCLTSSRPRKPRHSSFSRHPRKASASRSASRAWAKATPNCRKALPRADTAPYLLPCRHHSASAEKFNVADARSAQMTEPHSTSLIERAGLDRDDVRKEIVRGLEGADDGELFMEYRQSEGLAFDNGRLKQATYDTAQGF